MLYYRWGCFTYQRREIFRVSRIVRVNVIPSVEVIPYMLGSPESKLKQCHILIDGACHISVEWLSQLGKFSQLKLYCICLVSWVKVGVMLYYRWGCFLYQSRVVVRVSEIGRVILYMLGLPCQSQSYTGLPHVQSKFYGFHKLELILYLFVKFQ